MIFVICPFLHDLKCLEHGAGGFRSVRELQDVIHFRTGIPGKFFSVFSGRCRIRSNEVIPDGSSVYLGLSLPGGKGGFGSMLRAIGAQIEKTTNREACRDLTGRRLRDINEEQRLKKWLAKKAEREIEKQKRRKERLERMKQQPKHDFHDPEYNKQRSELPERIDDALSKGLQKAVPVLSKKRNVDEVDDIECEQILKKQCLLLGVDVPTDSDSSDQESPSCSDSSSRPVAESSEDTSESFAACSSSKSEAYQASEIVSCSGNTESASKSSCNDSVSQEEDQSSSIEYPSGSGSATPPVSDSEKLEKHEESAKEILSSDKKHLGDGISASDKDQSVPAATSHQDSQTSSVQPDSNSDIPSNIEKNPGGENDVQSSSENSQTSSKVEDISNVDLMSFESLDELESLGLDKLKSILMHLGLKCGGTLTERAQRLWSVRGLAPENYPSSLKAKPKKK